MAPEHGGATPQSFRLLPEASALARPPPPSPLGAPAEGEPLHRPDELRRIDRLIRAVESELNQIEFRVHQELAIKRYQPDGQETLATIDEFGRAAFVANAGPSGPTPRWSPDGKRIAYTDGHPGTKSQIFIV